MAESILLEPAGHNIGPVTGAADKNHFVVFRDIETVGQDIAHRYMDRVRNMVPRPFFRGPHIHDTAEIVPFQLLFKGLDGNRRQTVNGHSMGNPGRHAAGKVAENIVIADSMEFSGHLVILLPVVHHQQKIVQRVNNHADPVGHLFLKPDIDGARDMETTEGARVPGVNYDCSLPADPVELIGVQRLLQWTSFQERRTLSIGIDNYG